MFQQNGKSNIEIKFKAPMTRMYVRAASGTVKIAFDKSDYFLTIPAGTIQQFMTTPIMNIKLSGGGEYELLSFAE